MSHEVSAIVQKLWKDGGEHTAVLSCDGVQLSMEDIGYLADAVCARGEWKCNYDKFDVKKISLRECGIHIEGAVKILQKLPKRRGLEVDLSMNSIESSYHKGVISIPLFNSFLYAISKAFANGSIKSLCLTSNPLHVTDLKIIQEIARVSAAVAIENSNLYPECLILAADRPEMDSLILFDESAPKAYHLQKEDSDEEFGRVATSELLRRKEYAPLKHTSPPQKPKPPPSPTSFVKSPDYFETKSRLKEKDTTSTRQPILSPDATGVDEPAQPYHLGAAMTRHMEKSITSSTQIPTWENPGEDSGSDFNDMTMKSRIDNVAVPLTEMHAEADTEASTTYMKPYTAVDTPEENSLMNSMKQPAAPAFELQVSEAAAALPVTRRVSAPPERLLSPTNSNSLHSSIRSVKSETVKTLDLGGEDRHGSVELRSPSPVPSALQFRGALTPRSNLSTDSLSPPRERPSSPDYQSVAPLSPVQVALGKDDDGFEHATVFNSNLAPLLSQVQLSRRNTANSDTGSPSIERQRSPTPTSPVQAMLHETQKETERVVEREREAFESKPLLGVRIRQGGRVLSARTVIPVGKGGVGGGGVFCCACLYDSPFEILLENRSKLDPYVCRLSFCGESLPYFYKVVASSHHRVERKAPSRVQMPALDNSFILHSDPAERAATSSVYVEFFRAVVDPSGRWSYDLRNPERGVHLMLEGVALPAGGRPLVGFRAKSVPTKSSRASNVGRSQDRRSGTAAPQQRSTTTKAPLRERGESRGLTIDRLRVHDSRNAPQEGRGGSSGLRSPDVFARGIGGYGGRISKLSPNRVVSPRRR